MKRLIALIAFMLIAAATVYAADDIEVKCKEQGGCLFITQHAYDFLLGEISKLTNIIAKMKKEQCA
mgnify:FL=1